MTRDVEPARLVFWEPDGNRPAVLGHEYQTAGIRFELDLGDESRIGQFLRQLWDHPQSGVVQTVLLQVLYAFLAEYARNPVPPGSPPWMQPSRASVFVARNLRTLVLFHLLERWHPPAGENRGPGAPFVLDLAALAGCFTAGV